jgi:hypothetical protein
MNNNQYFFFDVSWLISSSNLNRHCIRFHDCVSTCTIRSMLVCSPSIWCINMYCYDWRWTIPIFIINQLQLTKNYSQWTLWFYGHVNDLFDYWLIYYCWIQSWILSMANQDILFIDKNQCWMSMIYSLYSCIIFSNIAAKLQINRSCQKYARRLDNIE